MAVNYVRPIARRFIYGPLILKIIEHLRRKPFSILFIAAISLITDDIFNLDETAIQDQYFGITYYSAFGQLILCANFFGLSSLN